MLIPPRHCKGDENICFASLEGSLQLVFFEEEVGWALYCLENSGGGREVGQGLLAEGGGGGSWSSF